MTWPIVRQTFPGWTAQFEGRFPWMYLDAKGIVTTAVGLNIGDVNDALGLPWQHPDGSRASRDDITAAWNTVHDAQHLAGIGGGSSAFRDLTSLRLPSDVIDRLTLATFDANDRALPSVFPSWDRFPADAQEGIHSMAYAMGVDRLHREFPRFIAFANALDFENAARESHMSEIGNAPLHARNVADFDLFRRAARVLADGLPLDAFYSGPLDVPPLPPPPPVGRGGAIAILLLAVGGAAWFATRHL